MPGFPRGLHESLITEELAERLRQIDADLQSQRSALGPAEAADRIAGHVRLVVQRAIESVREEERASVGVKLARDLVARIAASIAVAEVEGDAPVDPGEVLHAIVGTKPDGTAEEIETPLIPLLDTTLLANSPGEPHVGHQILTEIHSADRIDVVMAFIRRTGIAPMMKALRRHCEAGRALRVLTTTYTGSTELAALEQLADLGADVRVSYDTRTTRLHAKAWLFQRRSGFSTAYVGSSNLTHSAQVSGLEWNIRVSGSRNPDVIDKIRAVFDSYWNSPDFEVYDRETFEERTAREQPTGPRFILSPIELRPEPFQERLLEQIELARQQGHHRNLLVAATGTGKTVMAAVDYARLRRSLDRARLLFVAHRAEILEQSLLTFRQALRDQAFGELWVGGQKPKDFEHVFASIQSLSANDLSALDPEHFDVVIVDEFHHAAAPSYTRLLEHVQPKELLGLTATPERGDGLSILDHFDGRIAAELRLWDAIDRQRLCPFLYYGISDGLDLREVPWRRGRGYDVEGLTNILTANDLWARLVLQQLIEHVDDIATVRCLGFCVSVAHARFMARVFRAAGVEAEAVSGESTTAEREAALRDLDAGRLQVLFSVDLFNEGVDVPTVDTLLLLRPTDSATLFLQQLGRGLRTSPGKTVCTVLDFVGQHRKEYRVDRRYRALLATSGDGLTRKELVRQIEAGFPYLPAGCQMELDAVASQRVLAQIRAAIPSHWAAKAEELKQVAASDASRDVSLARFLAESDLELEDVYQGKRGWSELREAAGLPIKSVGPKEEALRRAVGRLLHIDDETRIAAYRRFLESEAAPNPGALPEPMQRLLRMLIASTSGSMCTKDASLYEGAELLWEHPQVRAELLQLLDALRSRISHVHVPLTTHPDSPLRVHARYTRREIQAALGIDGDGARIASWQTGVRWAKEIATDALAFTLDKSSSGFSPTTRYRDYAISRDLIHWESQNSAREASPTGQRYQTHESQGSHVLLFARLSASDRAFWCLGPATYVAHESERPMQVTWKLRHPLPGDLFAAFAAAVA